MKKRFSPRLFELQWSTIRRMSESLLPYKKPLGAGHYWTTKAFSSLLSDTEYADPQTMRELQLRRLREIVALAQRIPWWNSRLAEAELRASSINSLNDIRHLPPIDKHSFPKDMPRERFLTVPLPKERVVRGFTSGTTGEPFEWWWDINTWFVETSAYFHRALTWHAPSIAKKQGHPLIASFVRVSYDTPNIPLSWNPMNRHADAQLRWIVQTIQRERIRAIFSYPTNLLLFAKKIAQTGEQLSLSLALTVGQQLDDDARQYISKQLGCPVVPLYGSREFGQMAVECPLQRHRYHVNSERLYLEILDEEGEPVPDGYEGLITITSLENKAMPLLRYQLGDRGRIISESCPCGRTLPLLEFFGRSMDFIRLSSGEQIPFRNLNTIVHFQFFDYIEWYQVQQISQEAVVMRFKLHNINIREFEERFLPQARIILGGSIKIIFEYPRTIPHEPGEKLKMFVPLK